MLNFLKKHFVIAYRTFDELPAAAAMSDILRENGIDVEISDDGDAFSSVLAGNAMKRNYYVKLRAEDFEKADHVLQTVTKEQISDTPEDYYLYQFSNDELFDIICKPDEWNEFDYMLARKLLTERGKDVSDDTIELLKKQRLNELGKPEILPHHRQWIFAGYLFALLGGLIGFFIGWQLNGFKKTLPNGERVYGYSDIDRRHGRFIMIIGGTMFLLAMIARFVRG